MHLAIERCFVSFASQGIPKNSILCNCICQLKKTPYALPSQDIEKCSETPELSILLKKTSLQVEMFIIKITLLDLNLFSPMSQINPSLAEKTGAGMHNGVIYNIICVHMHACVYAWDL